MINLTAESERMILWHKLNWPYRCLSRNIWTSLKFGLTRQNLVRPRHKRSYAKCMRFISVKTETASEMCADENKDLVDVLLIDGRYPESSTSKEK